MNLCLMVKLETISKLLIDMKYKAKSNTYEKEGHIDWFLMRIFVFYTHNVLLRVVIVNKTW